MMAGPVVGMAVLWGLVWTVVQVLLVVYFFMLMREIRDTLRNMSQTQDDMWELVLRRTEAERDRRPNENE
jgi:uncharacterized membrane protein